jgi:hypothetical protein
MGSNPSKKSSGTTAPSSDDDEQFDGDGHLLGAGAHDTADGTGGLDEATSSGSEYYTDSESEEGMEGSRHGGHGSATLGSEGEDYSFSGSGSHDGSGESACSTDEEERMWVVVDPPESSLRTIQPQPGSELELSNAAATLEAALCFALVQSPGGASLPGALQARFQPTRFGGGAADALVQQMVRRMVRGCMWGGFTRWAAWAGRRRRLRELGVSAVARLRQRLSHRGWGGWLDGVAAQRQERRAVQMLARLTQQGLCCAVRGWRDHVLTLQRQRAIMRRVTVQLQQRSLGAAWGSWVDFVEAVHEAAREAVRSAAVRLPCRHP